MIGAVIGGGERSMGDFFDFNHDGKLDALEWSAKMEFWDEVSKDHSSSYGKARRNSRRPVTSSGRPANKAGASAGSRACQTGGVAQKRKVQIDPAERVLLKILFAVVCFALIYCAFMGMKHVRDRDAELGRIQTMLNEYKNRVPKELPGFCEERGILLAGSYAAEGFPEMTKSPGSGSKYQFYEVKFDYAVTLEADQYFDRLDDRTKYDYLCALYQMTGSAYDAFMRESFPEILESDGWTAVEGLCVSNRGGEREVYIKTQAHVYQYSKMYDDLFILDGESYFLEDEKSRWRR